MFGASGAIGGNVAARALERGWTVVAVSRAAAPADRAGMEWLRYDPLDDTDGQALDGQAPFDAVCWAQGANMADSPAAFDMERHLDLYRANCLTVLVALAALLDRSLLRAGGARLVVLSSIWQERARGDKLSYTMTKAAIGGLVRAASVDLGPAGHLINAVLPGVIDTPMARANLSPAQIEGIAVRTSAGRLADMATVAEAILFLCSAANGSITGQSITVDLGMSNAILV
ncbi:SDR family NAD(P)-dependent oxidoreductase [Sphingomonas hylomeconis]|uniref:SDR family NAD(P)-dependent oxidoreductase n=1 Tax=Sphingomonas hylomeconis TaxID=1395958 RepID=A0ABV7SWJ0_9SPHN|nr:SDR family oxidoreductase [Sphingomonas hylomeconis]